MTRFPRVSIVVLLLFSTGSGAGQEPLVAETKKRQAAIRSVDIKFHVKELVAKGSYTSIAEIMPGGKSGLVIPESEATIESDNRIAIDGRKVRFESAHPMWQLPSGTLVKKQTISVSNGELSKVFYPEGIGTNDEMTGIVRRVARVDEVQTYLVVPITMHFRGDDAALTPYNAQLLKRTRKSLPITGTVCECYEYPLSKDSVIEFWYDAAVGYALKRIRKLRRGTPYEQYEIQYQPAAGMESVPMSWVRTEYDVSGKVRKSTTVTVSEIRLNAVLDVAEFEITFPPGCHVHDQRESKEYRIQSSGSMRELGRDGQEVGASMSQPGEPWISRNKWLVVAIGVVSIVMALVFLQKRRKPSGTEPTGLSPPHVVS